MTREDIKDWKPGETLLLNGKMLTGRDAAHKKMIDMMEAGEELPVDLKGRFIYYVGPVDPCGTRWLAPPARRRPRAWTNLPARCWRKPA